MTRAAKSVWIHHRQREHIMASVHDPGLKRQRDVERPRLLGHGHGMEEMPLGICIRQSSFVGPAKRFHLCLHTSVDTPAAA